MAERYEDPRPPKPKPKPKPKKKVVVKKKPPTTTYVSTAGGAPVYATVPSEIKPKPAPKPKPKPRYVRPPDRVTPAQRRAIDREMRRNAQARLARLTGSVGRSTAAPAPRLTRQQELELAVDIYMGREPSFEAARRHVDSPLVKGIDFAFSPIGIKRGEGDPTNPMHYAILGANFPFMLPVGRPFRAGVAGVVGAKAALRGGTKAARPAAEGYMAGRGVTRRASSWGAGKTADALAKAGAPKGLSDFVRNSPDSKRWFRNRDSMIWVDPAKSRTGKLAEKAYDKARPVLSKGPTVKGRRIALAKTEAEKWAQALEAHHHEAWKQAQQALVSLDGVLSHGVVNRYFRRLAVPEYYALRMVGKGVDPETMVSRFRGLADEALAAGDNAKATRLSYHAAMAEKASPLVLVRGGDVVFSEAASRKLRTLYEHIFRAGENRERIYRDLDLLMDSNAEARRTNEELWHYGATFRETEGFIQERLEQSEGRAQLYDVLRLRDPDNADAAMQAIDANARQWAEQRLVNMAEGIQRLKAEVVTSRDPQKAALLKGLEREYKRGIDPDNFYRQWNETLSEFPEAAHQAYGPGVLMELRPFHAFAQKKAAANLKSKLNPKNLAKKVWGNSPIYRTFDGTRVVVAGKVTPAQWVKRVQTVMPDAEERAHWARWYDEFQPMFDSVFGEDSEKLMRGFAVSQANASPGSGLRAVLKIMDALSRGETVEKGYGSVVAASIAKAVEGGEIDKGIAAKLSDFIDSLMLSDTRTWMGHAAEGGRPVAVDVHAARDAGLVDNKLRARLKENFGLEEGTHYTVDNPAGSPSGPVYERVAEWYEGLTDHLNAVGFDGRSDWTPRQVQALGWAAIQKLHRVDPQDFAVALGQNTRRVSFEVTQGPGNLGDDLTPDQAMEVAKSLEPDMRRLVEQSGGYLNGIRHSVDGWQGGTNAATHLDVVASDENIDKLLTLLAQAFDQHLVQGTRTITRAGAKAALVISSDAFSDEATKTAFMKALYEASSELSGHGYMADTYMNLPAVKIVTGRGYLSPKTVDKFLDRYTEAIEKAEADLGITVEYGTKNTEIKIGDQVGEASFSDTAGRARELDDLDPVARSIRGRLQEAIERVRESHPASPEEVAARALERDRAAYDALLADVARAKGAKRVTEKQLADAEDETIKYTDRWPDDPWAVEFNRLRSSLGLEDAQTEELPGWLLSLAARRGRGLPDGLASGDAARPAGEAAAGAGDSGVASQADQGRVLLESRPGYAEAAEALRGGTLPVDFLKAVVADTKLAQYDKYRIGAHLDQLVREGGGGSIYGATFPSVPGLEEFLVQTTLRGMYRTDTGTIVVGPYGSIPTALHELMHMQQLKGLLPAKFVDDLKTFLKVEGDWTEKQLEDVAAILEASLLGFKVEGTKLPANIAGPLEKVRQTFIDDAVKGQQKNAEKMLERLDEAGELGVRLRDAVEHLYFFEPRKGHAFHGASREFRDRAKVYMPETLGLPASYGKDLFAMRSYAARLGGLLGHKSTILPGDKALSHQFTAHLLESGAFDRNIVKGTVYSQMKAARVHAMSVVQAEARKIGTPVPTSPDDIAIPLEANRFLGDQGKDIDFVAGMLNSINEGKVISEAELSKVDLKAIEQARDVLFPGSSAASEAEVRQLAEEILAGVREPIDGVVWVNRQDLVNTAVFKTPRQGTTLRAIDSVNDYLKALLLVLKPSYIPMNFIGNTAMALMQQGAFAPFNYAKAWRLNKALGDDAVLIDFFAGSGWMKSVFESKGGVPVVSKALDASAEISNWLVDRHWRRAAFFYEARKMGYRSSEDLRALLKDPANVDDLYAVSKRTKNAMVDFENLSSFEKDVMTRLVFVYPWFKGATFWTGRFVKDHPIQSAVYAYLLSQQQDRLNDAMPNGYPGYLKWFLPLGTRERDGKEMPYGLRMDQALTFLTPLDLASDIAAMTTGTNPLGGGEVEAGASYLNPLYEEFLKTLTGYDSFTGQPVSKSWLDFFARLTPTERSVAWQQLETIFSEEKRANSMYHPTKKEAWLKLFFGSPTPGVVDPDRAAERAAGHRPDAEARIDLWKAKAEEALGEEMPENVVRWKQNEQRYNAAEADYKHSKGIETGLSDQERAVVLFRTLAEIEGVEWSDEKEERVLGLPDDDALDDVIDELRERIGLTQIGKLDRAIAERRKGARVDG